MKRPTFFAWLVVVAACSCVDAAQYDSGQGGRALVPPPIDFDDQSNLISRHLRELTQEEIEELNDPLAERHYAMVSGAFATLLLLSIGFERLTSRFERQKGFAQLMGVVFREVSNLCFVSIAIRGVVAMGVFDFYERRIRRDLETVTGEKISFGEGPNVCVFVLHHAVTRVVRRWKGAEDTAPTDLVKHRFVYTRNPFQSAVPHPDRFCFSEYLSRRLTAVLLTCIRVPVLFWAMLAVIAIVFGFVLSFNSFLRTSRQFTFLLALLCPLQSVAVVLLWWRMNRILSRLTPPLPVIDDFVLYHYCGLADGRASLSDLASFRGESLTESLPPPEIHIQPSKPEETPSSDEEEDEQEERRRSDVRPAPKKSSIDFVLDERYYDAIDVDAILAQASEGREGLQQLLSAPRLKAPFESLPVVRQVGLTRKKPTHRQAQLFSTWTKNGIEKTEGCLRTLFFLTVVLLTMDLANPTVGFFNVK
ncbi:unnamed protein product [Vitrella brassicaformis CCMP3155]|uniref:Transmembrane protein n=1 Tax=Vitrella brassicaformis (strain CCMP3155) TaxID=1169540 RepID=A0A0G4EGP3_VITBC|nr:unnamed protein product [Vitrella brassicaformis CCMP3155]|eukprot:CEL94665.1 unnamed protein product [Vitrella brassicaformis CCMP3155]